MKAISIQFKKELKRIGNTKRETWEITAAVDKIQQAIRHIRETNIQFTGCNHRP